MQTFPRQFRPRLLPGVVPALLAVVLWSVAPVLATLAAGTPPLRLTALTLLAGALAAAPWSQQRNAGSRPLSPCWRLLIFGLIPLLMVGAIGAYFAGLNRAPAAEAALITYTWPVMFVVLSQWSSQGRVTASTLGGAGVAFSGAALLLAPQVPGSEAATHLSGCLLALLAGGCWALYSWLGQEAPVALTTRLPRLFLVASSLAAIASLLLEGTGTLPSGPALLAALALGLGPYGLAMVCWDRALRLGPSALVGSLAYGVPVLAALFLVVAGTTPPSWRLPVAAALVVAGCTRAGR